MKNKTGRKLLKSKLCLNIFILLSIIIYSSASKAQDTTFDILQEAKNSYEYGKFEKLDILLTNNIDRFEERDKELAYKLLALSSIAQDNYKQASSYIKELLNINPAYVPEYFDPVQFSKMFFEIKKNLSVFNLMDYKITSATKKSQNMREAPSSVNVLNTDYTNNYGWNSINDILYYSAGFFPAHDYERETVGARGLHEGWNNNHLLMMIDGVPVNGNINGTAFTWDITPLTFSRSIEIVRGPGAALYGSNATNGVITLNTKREEDFYDHWGYVKFSAGNLNTRRLEAISFTGSKHFNIITSYSRYKTKGYGYKSFDPDSIFDASRKYSVDNKQNNNYLYLKMQGKEKFKNFSAQYHHQDWEFGSGHGWGKQIPEDKGLYKQNREIFVLKYSPKNSSVLSQEYVVRHQFHNLYWNLFYTRGNKDKNPYNEVVNTNMQDIFARAQIALNIRKNISLLAGMEANTFLYNGDKIHYSNFSVKTFLLNENNKNRELGQFFEHIEKRPVNNLGFFTQASIGSFFRKKMKITVGMRYDIKFFKYDSILGKGKKIKSKDYQQLSPRIAVVYSHNKNTSIKVIAGKAFRAPAISEMFGANSFAVSSAVESLKPEVVNTMEIVFSRKLKNNFNFKLNGFYTISEEQTAYSQNNYKVINMSNQSIAGIESEFIFNLKSFTGFFNASFYRRIDEKIKETEQKFVSEHPEKITWAPGFTSNLGLNYRNRRFNFAIYSHYQGKVERREDDRFVREINSSVPHKNSDYIKAWANLNGRFIFVRKNMEFYVSATNILNTKNYLIRTGNYPFDYRSDKFRINLGVRINFVRD